MRKVPNLTLRREDGRVVAESVTVADSTGRRLRGLLGKKDLPSGQGVQSPPFIVPQVAAALLLTQTPPQRCQPVLHACTQVPAALQVTLPLSAGGVQTVHVLPHELMLVLPFATQVALAPVPHA